MSVTDAGPGTGLGTLGWFVGVWAVMIAAMLVPALAPTAAVRAQLTRRRGPSRSLLFAGGYVLVRSTAGVVAYGLSSSAVQFTRFGDGDDLELASTRPEVYSHARPPNAPASRQEEPSVGHEGWCA